MVDAMTTVHGVKGGQQARVSMETVLNSADEDMLNKITQIIEHIGQKVSRSAHEFLTNTKR